MPKLQIRKKELSRGACLVAAVLLIFGGILSLVAPGSVWPNIAFVFGMIMALAGVIFLLIYALMRSLPVGAEWILADGIACSGTLWAGGERGADSVFYGSMASLFRCDKIGNGGCLIERKGKMLANNRPRWAGVASIGADFSIWICCGRWVCGAF